MQIWTLLTSDDCNRRGLDSTINRLERLEVHMLKLKTEFGQQYDTLKENSQNILTLLQKLIKPSKRQTFKQTVESLSPFLDNRAGSLDTPDFSDYSNSVSSSSIFGSGNSESSSCIVGSGDSLPSIGILGSGKSVSSSAAIFGSSSFVVSCDSPLSNEVLGSGDIASSSSIEGFYDSSISIEILGSSDSASCSLSNSIVGSSDSASCSLSNSIVGSGDIALAKPSSVSIDSTSYTAIGSDDNLSSKAIVRFCESSSSSAELESGYSVSSEALESSECANSISADSVPYNSIGRGKSSAIYKQENIREKGTKANYFVCNSCNITVGNAGIRSFDENIRHDLPTDIYPTRMSSVNKNEYGFKRRHVDIMKDNRIRFHSGQLCFQGEIRENTASVSIEQPTSPNIKQDVPAWTASSDVDPVLWEVDGPDCPLSRSYDFERPRRMQDWLEYYQQTAAHSESRIISGAVRRGDGQNVILVLDTSIRMKGHKFEEIQMKAIQYVDGIEQVCKNNRDHRDNIGLAVFGHECQLVYDSTNDYGMIKKLIGQLKPAGDAPLFAGLLMGMAGVMAGPLLGINGCKIQGCMVVFTDGTAENSAYERKPGQDIDPNLYVGDFHIHAETSSVVRMIACKAIKIYYVPIGENRHNETLEHAAKETNGKTIQPSEIYRLIRMPQITRLAVRIACELRCSQVVCNTEIVRKKVMEMGNIEDRNDDCVDLVLEFVNPLYMEIREGMYAELNCYSLQLGDRVRRGRDWTYGEQDSHMPGTVIGQHKEGGILVKWDSGYRNVYQYNEHMHMYDIRKVNEPRNLVDNILAVGCRVQRGPNWVFGDYDGGSGRCGTVLKVLRHDGTAVVRWDCRNTGLYKIGYNGLFEVQICMKEMTPVTPHNDLRYDPYGTTDQDNLIDQKKYTANNLTGSNYVVPSYPKAISATAVWEYIADNAEWKPYPSDVAIRIEKAYLRKPTGKTIIKMNNSNYVIHFTKMIQEDCMNKTELPVRRLE